MKNETIDIDRILSDFVEEADAGRGTALAERIERYPEDADELRKFAMFQDIMALHESGAVDNPIAEAAFVERASSVAQRMRAKPLGAPASGMESLLLTAKRIGLSAVNLAERIGLSVSFVASRSAARSRKKPSPNCGKDRSRLPSSWVAATRACRRSWFLIRVSATCLSFVWRAT